MVSFNISKQFIYCLQKGAVEKSISSLNIQVVFSFLEFSETFLMVTKIVVNTREFFCGEHKLEILKLYAFIYSKRVGALSSILCIYI